MSTSMWLTRLRRSLLPGRDTVARPSDRIQAAVLTVVILSSLVAAAGAVLLGIGIHAGEADDSREQIASRYVATAVLVGDGPAPGTVGRSGTPGESGPAPAFWITRDGQRRTGEVDAPAGTVAGNEVAIWLDATGTPTDHPLAPAAATIDAVVIATGLWAGVVFLLAGLYFGVVMVLDRFRFADWQREWAALQTPRARRDDQSPAGS
ncbi:Rv1733c family protein [Amycolatopsis sp. RTGN1]|uniref:Rv1733c family protein n=1 Tax=Amycolatopsis ponsaeliensis TaxID=2992142 RepID=UPI00254C094E|nr:hypothetical protein [Amycolatopsis sp. RTGN1]